MLTYGGLQTPSITYVPGCEKTTFERPAPCGPITITAEWNKIMVFSREGTGLSGNNAKLKLCALAVSLTTRSMASWFLNFLIPDLRIKMILLRGAVFSFSLM